MNITFFNRGEGENCNLSRYQIRWMLAAMNYLIELSSILCGFYEKPIRNGLAPNQVFNAVPLPPFSAAAELASLRHPRRSEKGTVPFSAYPRRATTLRSCVVRESKGVCPLGRRTRGSVREGEAESGEKSERPLEGGMSHSPSKV